MHQLNYCKLLTPSDPVTSYNTAISERPSNYTSNSGGRKKRGIGEHTKYWQPGKTLKILVFKFDEQSFDVVQNAASKWLPYVNLKFEFIEMDEQDIFASEERLGDIRVDFHPKYAAGGISYLGTDSLIGNPHAPSMMLGTKFDSPHYESMVIHEFGHALGLNHEHQHPDAGIPWDREKAYFHFAASANLSKAEVDANVFPRERNPDQIYTPYDRLSIMHYEVNNELTVGNWHQPANMQISDGDIAMMRRIYP
ncbi:MAG: M12 family metallopeptidase [Pseudomonas sp.]|uniref:M12 family metallopeptidase n=1 Tax=Pseudomonas sp. TaxID=306 RepID=UPI003D6FBC52